MVTTKDRDLRFEEPLYTVAEASAYLRVPRTTFETWAHGYTRRRQGQRVTKARSDCDCCSRGAAAT